MVEPESPLPCHKGPASGPEICSVDVPAQCKRPSMAADLPSPAAYRQFQGLLAELRTLRDCCQGTSSSLSPSSDGQRSRAGGLNGEPSAAGHALQAAPQRDAAIGKGPQVRLLISWGAC